MGKMHPVSLGNALVWGTVILAAAVILRGTEFATILIAVLGGAAGISILLVEKALRRK